MKGVELLPLAAKSLRIACGGRPGVRGGLVLHGFASCEDLAFIPARTRDPFHLHLDRYCHMCGDDLEMCRQYTDNLFSDDGRGGSRGGDRCNCTSQDFQKKKKKKGRSVHAVHDTRHVMPVSACTSSFGFKVSAFHFLRCSAACVRERTELETLPSCFTRFGRSRKVVTYTCESEAECSACHCFRLALHSAEHGLQEA